MDRPASSEEAPGLACAIACVNVPELPLQLLLRRKTAEARSADERSRWLGSPVAVIDRDAPQGRLLWVSEPARRAGIVPGMTYAAAHSLSADLLAAEVPAEEVEAAVESLVRVLIRFTPTVEPCREDPGVFWLSLRGLERLHPSLRRWAESIRSTIEGEERLRGIVVLGFSRFGTYAVARSRDRGGVIFRDAEEERAASRAVPLDRLPVGRRVPAGRGKPPGGPRGLAPEDRALLEKLGVRTVGEFADLPPEGIERRFGKEGRWVHALARGEQNLPLAAAVVDPPLRGYEYLEQGESDLARISERVEGLLLPLFSRLASRGKALAELRIGLGLENGDRRLERLRPAIPTLDPARIRELVDLRLATLELPDRVGEVEVTVDGQAAPREQLELFAALGIDVDGGLGVPRSRRDLDAADRALARVRAELGDDAVVRARVREAHLPEARYAWEPLARLPRTSPKARPAGEPPAALVRRIWSPAIPLAPRPRHEPDGWIVRSLAAGPVVRLAGPYIVSGGWWRRPSCREYHFAETQKGEVLWVYHDRPRRRWFLQGRVE